MAEEYATKQVEVAGQIVCELIRKDILPKVIGSRAGMPASEVGDLFGILYQHIWKAISTAPTSK